MWLIRPVVRWISATSDQVRTWRIAVQNVVAGRESRAMLIFILAEAQGTQRDLQVFVDTRSDFSREHRQFATSPHFSPGFRIQVHL